MAEKYSWKPMKKIRKVFSYNLGYELALIRGLVKKYPFIAMDTEFPGFLYRHVPGAPAPFLDGDELRYYYIRRNVNALKLIQLGLALSDPDGNLPLVQGAYAVWEFNFHFSLASDLGAPDSMELLMKTDINFAMNYYYGIDPARFGRLMVSSGLVMNESVRWITFHGVYDFAYLVKAIRGGEDLPVDVDDFLSLVVAYFGLFYDVKYLMRFCGLFGGLEQLGKSLEVKRAVGNCHEAASDSLLTMDAFFKMKQLHFPQGIAEDFAGRVHGL
ncbi:hypothetical protein ACLOJK_005953 [Asimina triloba]